MNLGMSLESFAFGSGSGLCYWFRLDGKSLDLRPSFCLVVFYFNLELMALI